MSSTFPLTDTTVAILENFANINQQVQFKAGHAQRTCNMTRNFIADVELPDPIPVDCSLYALNRLLGVIDTTKGASLPELTFGEQSLLVTHENGSVTLPYAHDNVIPAPPAHKYTLLKQYASFDLPAALWQKIKRTAAVLQTTSLQFCISSGKLTLNLINDKDKGGESIGWGSYNMPNTLLEPGVADNVWVVKFDALEFLPGDYQVAIGDLGTSTPGASAKGSAGTSGIFGAFFTLNDPVKKVTYLTSGHVVKTR